MSGLGFALDGFQERAIDALDAGHSVVVAAPTGSGKTVVAGYAVARALAEGAKAFYTTPLKALSNQKYAELVAAHGSKNVGLLTGDNVVNGDAPIVVMTTEVLRNMIYGTSPALTSLRYVILDEVHYLQNAYRGPVWEEVIIHSPPEVDLVCLSATVSNAEELADWIRTVRGDTTAIIEERRPVELDDLYLVGDRSSERLTMMPTLVDGRANPEAVGMEQRAAAARRRGPGAVGGRDVRRGRGRSKLYTPRRSEVVELLDDEAMLPAIYFIFSRAACDDAVIQCLREAGPLTTVEEQRQIREIAEAHTSVLGPADRTALDYRAWLSGLEAGYAAHHAGMVPPMKEAVEACFGAGLVKVVFATETLALGINMPARTVVIEKLTKFTGERHDFLTPGEYTQLTGRAGRRGIDDIGYAVVLWSPWVAFEQVAGLVDARTYALRSSFRPTYNMAANLVRRYEPEVAHHLLNLSLAQYQADSEVVRLETELRRAEDALDSCRHAAVCDRGDIEEYRRLARARDEAARQRPADAAKVSAALARLKPGDVLVLPGRKSDLRVAVVSTARRRGGEVRLRAVTAATRNIPLDARDFVSPPEPVGRISLPAPYAPNSPSFTKHTARRLRAAKVGPPGRTWRSDVAAAHAKAAAAHPVASCPEVHHHLRAAERAERHARDADRLKRRVKSRSESIARQFDRVLGVLDDWGYVDGWALTQRGEVLARLYHECDLLVAECLAQGVFDGLDPVDLAGLASTLSFESRGNERVGLQIDLPNGPKAGKSSAGTRAEMRRRWASIEEISGDLNRLEFAAGLPTTRSPDPGFVAAARAWASGGRLSGVLDAAEVTGGDFVRNLKQLIDLLSQIGNLSTTPATARAARDAAELLFRGVVAASSAAPAA